MVITEGIPNNDVHTANDPLHLASSDHPGMALTSTSFNVTNFLGWSRTVKMALGAKLKLGFIYGTMNKPAITDLNFPRYRQSNGPLIYQIESERSKVNQGSQTVATYYNKLKRYWDELLSLNGVPMCGCGKMRECTCGIIEKYIEIDNRGRDAKKVTQHEHEPTAFYANNKGGGGFGNVKKFAKDEKKCTFCSQEGHGFEQCFERIGYPDWYKGRKGKKCNIMAAQIATDFSPFMYRDTPFDFEGEVEVNGGKHELGQKLVNAACQEMMKMFKGKGQEQDTGASFHTSLQILAKRHSDFNFKIDWIIDTGASNHMSPHIGLFQSIRELNRPIRLKLPDGTSKWVKQVGSVKINPTLTLTQVFYVPDFKVNLLSVGTLLKSKFLLAIFFPTWFVFQDPSIKQVVAAGEGFNNFYI
ncbi:uncharacterized protein [Rutidosis leptorrhynchoides]|uniref:uncharacterized protein n=1 Tax=Rutidosis leptorrhynchoides TaxID=125765 RepID=UPI003A9A4E03